MKFFTARAIALGVAFGTSYVVGCSSQAPSTPGVNAGGGVGTTYNPGSGNSTGSVGLSLTTGGVTIDSASYAITGPGGFTKSGTFPVGDTISVVVDGLPAGMGFSVTITADAGDAAACSGSAPFDVIGGATTSVTVHLQCKVARKKTGSVSINGVLNFCPTLDSLSTTPNEVAVGETVSLVASASDDDSGPGPLTYSWISTSGTFADPTAASTTFTCTAAGTATITVSVSDSDCGDTASTTVTCDASATPDAGTTTPEAGVEEASVPEAGGEEASVPEAGGEEASVPEAGGEEASVPEAGGAEASVPEAGGEEASVPEASIPEASVPEASLPEAGVDASEAGGGTPCGPGGSTQACLEAQAPDCFSCAQTNGCLDPAQLGGTCELTTGTANLLAGALPDGTTCSAIFPTGVTETTVCLDTLGTVFTSKCAATLQETPCLCGATDASQCLGGSATPTGPGYNTYSCDFGSTSSTAIQTAFTNQAFGAGQANALIQCAASFGCASCFGQ